MPLAMLIVIVGAGLGLLMSNALLVNITETRTSSGRAASLLAARSGLSSALGTLRAARLSGGGGDTGELPCLPAGGPAVTGTAGSGSSAYAVTIRYLLLDPEGRSLAWVQANSRPCADQLAATPNFAHLTAVGTTAGGNRRTLSATYVFKTEGRTNTAGGRIKVLDVGGTNRLCLDAGNLATVYSGIPLRMRLCNPADFAQPAVPQQRFGYQPNATINLVGADPARFPTGLCVDTSGVGAQALNQKLVLKHCASGSGLARQQWYINTASGFFGPNADRTGFNSFCWSVQQRDTDGSEILLNSTSGGVTGGNSACNTSFPNNYQSWHLDGPTGSGPAGPATRQLVNYETFSRCFDYDSISNIVKTFPCKGHPDPASTSYWNQIWYLPEPGQAAGPVYYLTTGGTKRCIVAPPNPHATDSEDLKAGIVDCPAVLPRNMLFVNRGADTPTFDEAYRIEGTGTWAGTCMGTLGRQAGEQGVVVGFEPCTGHAAQKWNADARTAAGGLTGVVER
ncbi:hypothetical protein Sya03_58350 [Spirilliplanes yamanashiensis]|uniref:Uncharacterized protein n=2 Tax=Spirilliplanes yamanashiensis TaxID=42233 RepID=A0A8J3YDA5_9ACTN|nr:hypothetical protein Sya03_58350 [Spirilliplanes yamanashiensis]